MKSLTKYNKGIKSLLCSIDIFSKYEWVFPLKDRWRVIIVNVSQKKISKSSEAKSKGRKPNEIWIDQGGEFYNNLYKRFLKINDIKMYSTYDK